MDRVRAADLENELRGQAIDGWVVESLIDHGKSAAVFLARRDTQLAALKVFDNELIERYGDKSQKARIERELSLVGKHHQNLVQILGGGFDERTKNHYVVMEYVEGETLRKVVSKLPPENIPKLITQLADAASYLEQNSICHRDIKPDNIMVKAGLQSLVLLDLGVLRPFGESGVTDGDGIHPFIGTLQYSSPEFLLRQEEDSVDGWRAVTFYQIGGVLHDLIMRRPLFAEFAEPYARLVLAVQNETPDIQSSEVSNYWVNLAGRCLLKDPKKRLRLVKWDDFKGPQAQPLGLSAKQRVTTRISLALARGKETSALDKAPSADGVEALRHGIVDFIKAALRSIRDDNSVFPPISVESQAEGKVLLAHFERSPAHQLLLDLHIFIGVEILDAAAKAISITASTFLGPVVPDAHPADASVIVFEGIYDGDLIYKVLEEFIYRAIDQGQGAGEEGGKWITPFAD